jgi:hypothetical protein
MISKFKNHENIESFDTSFNNTKISDNITIDSNRKIEIY